MAQEARLVLMMNLALSLFMTGVIWYVQIVHYPLFHQVGQGQFATYHAAHTSLTTTVVALPMLAELGLSLLLVVARPAGVSAAVAWLLCGLVVMIFAVTALISVPIHAQLGAGGYEPALVNRLVNTNWLRTVAWTARSVILLSLALGITAHTA